MIFAEYRKMFAEGLIREPDSQSVLFESNTDVQIQLFLFFVFFYQLKYNCLLDDP